MKAITLWQPHASLVAIGAKKIETRPWATKYRGPLAIHAAVSTPGGYKGICFYEPYRTALKKLIDVKRVIILPQGAVLATCQVVDCIKITLEFASSLTDQERAFGDYTPGRYAWILGDVLMLPEPIPAKGAQRLWDWEMPRTEAVVMP